MREGVSAFSFFPLTDPGFFGAAGSADGEGGWTVDAEECRGGVSRHLDPQTRLEGAAA